jgi:hypothetical protein
MKTIQKENTEVKIRQRIERYINNNMSDREKEDFEADMDVDVDFAKEVAAIYIQKIRRQKQSKLVNNQLVVINTGCSKSHNSRNWLSKIFCFDSF